MPNSYAASVEELLCLGHELGASPAIKFDLAHMRVLLDGLGHPERRFPSVLIAGTNGKGSTSATLAAILRQAGYRTGLFTSPHLIHINERIRCNGEAISNPEFAEIHSRVEMAARQLEAAAALPRHPSFFEMLTAMAFEYFASTGVDLVVLEVGMGGRLDATNTVSPCLSVITDIALDHQKYLGESIAEIAAEKAGIIRPGGVVVTLPQHPEANQVIGRICLERNARAVSAARFVPPVSPGAGRAGRQPGGMSENGNGFDQAASHRGGAPGFRSRYRLNLGDGGAGDDEITVKSPLVGRHQLRNVALAIAAAQELKPFGFPITPRQVESGIEATQWPGRFQFLPPGDGLPGIILDVAHNPAGAWALRSTLSEYCPENRLIFLFGAMRDKAIGEITEILFPLAGQVIVTRARSPRAATPEEIQAAAERTSAEIQCQPSVAASLNCVREMVRAASPPPPPGSNLPGAAARHLPQPGDLLLVITGSIYVVGEALQILGIE